MSAINTQALAVDDQLAVARWIAHVLGRAHRTAEARNAPQEARAILHVALSFADELETTDSRFDRTRFIQAATEHQSETLYATIPGRDHA